MSAAFYPANRGLSNAETGSRLMHFQAVFETPLSKVHGGNIRQKNNTSNEFYASGDVPGLPLMLHDGGMGKKSKKPTFIKKWRKHRGLTQDQLAEQLGLTQATVARIENGKIAYTQPVLEAMADILRCEPADLIMRDPSRKDAAWSMLDGIAKEDMPRVVKILEAFKKSGTEG